MRNHLTLFLLILGPVSSASAQSSSTAAPERTVADVRAELEKAYQANTAAFMRWDLAAVMALRAPDFHTVTPDGATQDRQAMEQYIHRDHERHGDGAAVTEFDQDDGKPNDLISSRIRGSFPNTRYVMLQR